MTAPVDLALDGMRSNLRGPFSAILAGGTCSVVTGPSGIGKSLFLRMIADLDPNEGRVALGETARSAVPAPVWRRLVTYVAAESGWWAETVDEHMSDRDAARRLFPELGLDGALLEAPVARLSTGERQRAALVRAVVGHPRFLLLDEPTSALDHDTKRRVEAVLAGLKRDGVGLVVVSHDADQAGRLADRRFEMSLEGLSEVSP